MAVIRVGKSRNYTVMSNYHLREKNMSFKAKGMLSVMLSLPDNWDYSIAGLASISKENETAVKSTLNELKEFGYVKVTKLMPNESSTGRIEYIYDVYEKPIQEGEKQGVENLPVEILPVEVQAVEHQGQLNTKESNTKELNTKESNTNKKETVTSIIEEAPVELQENLNDFIEMRKKNKSAMTVKAVKLLISKLDKLSGGDIAVSNAILEQSIINGWKSVYELKGGQAGGQHRRNSSDSFKAFDGFE